MTSRSPALFSTVQRPGSAASQHGGDIQFSGLYEPPSEWMSTDPSALTSNNRRAGGRCAVSRPDVVDLALGNHEAHGLTP